MPRIEPKNDAIRALQGLHLWHAPMSSCSQRVRITLTELGRDFESHIVDLAGNEHATPEYQAIHPKGLVPALVEDGELWIESVDIIQHIAEAQPALMAGADEELLQMADDAQPDLKLLTHEFLFKMNPPPPPEKAAKFQETHENPVLRQFKLDFAAGFDPDRINACIARTDAGFRHLDGLLSEGREYLGGDTFSVTDVAWMPNVHRMKLMDWPFERTPHLQDWFARVAKRRSFQQGLLAWQPEPVPGLFAEYSAKRHAEGTGVRSFPHFSDG